VAVGFLELVINNRPTYASTSTDRDGFFIRPGQFVYPNHPDNVDRTIANILAPLSVEVDNPELLVQKVVEQRAFYRKLNEVFQDNYSSSLNKWHTNVLFKEKHHCPEKDKFRIGQVVLILPDKDFKNSPWHKVRWGMGEIVDIHRNQHGHIRTVDVVEMDVNGKRSIKRRHGVHNFAPLEISDKLVDGLKKLKEPAAGLPDQV
jgi:Family of unknown function (DUF5641)